MDGFAASAVRDGALRHVVALIAAALVAVLVLGAPVAWAGPPASAGNMVSVFHDDFDGTSLNTSVWERGWNSDADITGPMSGRCVAKSNVAVGFGGLRLTLTKLPAGQTRSCSNEEGTRTVDWLGGLVDSKPRANHPGFKYFYGYVEWLARTSLSATGKECEEEPFTPDHCIAGLPQLWSFDDVSRFEIDTFEGEHGKACYNLHPPTPNGSSCQSPGAFADGLWHRFASLWTPSGVDYYYDGAYVGHRSGNATSQYLVMDIIQGAPHVDGATLDVDYVRVWQKDTDGDSVPDAPADNYDRCPNVPGPAATRGCPPPTATTGGATAIEDSAATLTATVDPHGFAETSYHFEYGLTTNYEHSTDDESTGSALGAHAYNKTVTGLLPNRTYHFRVVAENPYETTYGVDRTFTTAQRYTVFYPDSTGLNSLTAWSQTTAGAWTQTPLFGHPVAANGRPAAAVAPGTGRPRAYFADTTNNNSITEWSWSVADGWQQTFLFGHPVAAGSSPSAVMENGDPRVYFVDDDNNNSISEWVWDPGAGAGWQQRFLFGHPVAANSSPAAVMDNGSPDVFFVDADNNNTITAWSRGATWNQQPLWGHPVAAGTSPAAVVDGHGQPNVAFADAYNNNTVTVWTRVGGNWQQQFLWGHRIAAGTSPSAVSLNGVPHVFFVDAENNNSISDWFRDPTYGWLQAQFFGHEVAAGTSPSATIVNGKVHVSFVDATNNNSVTDWTWNATDGWQQQFLFGHAVAPGSSTAGG